MQKLVDPLFRVKVLTQTPNPQTAIWYALRQDYSSDFVGDITPPSEQRCGEIAVNRLLQGKRGHYGPLEHVHIVFNVGFFPHSVMQQARTHRVGVSFDVQSLRYTSEHIIKAVDGSLPIDEVFYLRPVGQYTNREGKKYTYTDDQRDIDANHCWDAAMRYAAMIEAGYAEEHARGIIPFDIRQHFVVSFSLRALLHFLDLRAKADAQPEIAALADLMVPEIERWVPEIWQWYAHERYGKALLAP